jgi:hypothetical protein
LPSEISQAKRKVIGFFGYLAECPLEVTRRQAQLRLAHDAESKYIVGIFNLLDNLDVLDVYEFAAVNRDRLPKYTVLKN